MGLLRGETDAVEHPACIRVPQRVRCCGSGKGLAEQTEITPAVPMIRVSWPGWIMPAPKAELSELPLATGVPALMPVSSAASRVTCPMISSEGSTAGKRARGMPKRSKSRSDQARFSTSNRSVPLASA